MRLALAPASSTGARTSSLLSSVRVDPYKRPAKADQAPSRVPWPRHRCFPYAAREGAAHRWYEGSARDQAVYQGRAQATGPAQSRPPSTLPLSDQLCRFAETDVAVYNRVRSLQILLTIPLAFYAIFQLSWVGSFLTQYYSVRARALASLVAALVQILGNLLFGYFLDYQSLSLNKRAKYGFAGMMALHGGTWIWATIVQHDYETRAVKPAFDWSDPGFARGWVLYLFVQLCFSTIYNYAFWFIGGLARNSNEVVRFTSIIRSWESAGGAVACTSCS